MKKILFMGTPGFAAASLAALYESGEYAVTVVTQPDKPKGRGYAVTPPEVKVYALEHGLTVYQPATLRDEAFASLLAEIDPDMIVVAAYGKILPKNVIDYPEYGCINVHGSLLPEYRGAAPVQRAIIDGRTVTGITIMYMAEGLDTGDMLEKAEVPIDENDDFVKRIHEKVEEVNRDTEVTEIMTIEEEMNIRWHYGYDEGEAAGVAKEKREIAKSMKDEGIAKEVIEKITGLSAEEVEKL